MNNIGPTLPVLDEKRLSLMWFEAAQIYNGFKAPRQSSARDVLFLVAEVRSLRQQLEERTRKSAETFSYVNKVRTDIEKEQRSVWDNFDAILDYFKDLHKKKRS